MRKFGLTLVGVIAGLYFVLHVALGSSPVQKRVLSEIRNALYAFGLDLEIESIDFSAFAPRIYLNRVTLKPTPQFDIPLPEPLTVDKIKIEFRPIALLYKEVVIEEIALFYPKILIPQGDTLYKKIQKLINDKKKLMVKGGNFNVVFKRMGVVDALFEVRSKDPDFAVRSRSLSFFIEQNTNGQQTVTVESKNLEFDRGPLKLRLTKTDLDVDLTKDSMRINRATLEGDGLAINVKGASSIPILAGRKDESLRAEYDVMIPVALLKDIPELKTPLMTGKVISKGSVNITQSKYSGSGSLNYQDLNVEGYAVGRGGFSYNLDKKRAHVKGLKLHVGTGEITSDSLTLDFEERYPVAGEFKVVNVKFDNLLKILKDETPHVFGELNGTAKVSGHLKNQFQLDVSIKQDIRDLYVLDKLDKPRNMENAIIEIPTGSVDGSLKITEAGVSVSANAKALDGTVAVTGNIGFDNKVLLKIDGQNISLTKLAHIAEVPFSGSIAWLKGQLDVRGSNANIGGDFEIQNGAVADLELGPVKGKVFYEDKLLSFERLELPSLEPIQGSGYVDFRPKKNHYLFNVSARRALIDQIFAIFNRMKLDFPKPDGGEASARVSIEGGHDEHGPEVKGTGMAKGFKWYDERWLNSNFSFTYRPKFVDIHRASFLKRSGALDVRAHFEKEKSFLQFSSQGLRLEEFNYFGRAPVSGELLGSLRLEGDLTHPAGNGDIQVNKASFRGKPIPDSTVKIRTSGETTEFLANVSKDQFRARLLRKREGASRERSDLLLYFKDFDFMPLLSIFMGKDLPSLTYFKATGDFALEGILQDWESMKGSGSVNNLELGLKTSPMKNERPIQIAIGGGVFKVDRFRLLGNESQLFLDFLYEHEKNIKGSLDGKLDLEYLQPFIPGVEYGVGKVGVSLRLSGPPKKFTLLGSASLEDGTFRLKGLTDEFKNSQIQLSSSQDRINVDRFQANLGGGDVQLRGDVQIDRFRKLEPNLSVTASRVNLKTRNFLTTQFTGNFSITGKETPYLFAGRCSINEARLTDFNMGETLADESEPVLRFDIKGEARDRIFVTTDVMDAEFRGSLNLVGDTSNIGLLGSVDGIKGSLLFKETRFGLTTATVKFEEREKVMPRFNVSGRAVVQEQRTDVPQNYEVNLQVFGTPKDYKIRLTSVPSLAEPDLISLLVLGVTTRGQDGNYLDLGSVISGQTPFQSKIQNEFGVDIKMGTQTRSPVPGSSPSGPGSSTPADQTVVPSVKIQKKITDKTQLSYSTTVGEEIPYKEFRIEHLLNENFTLNGTALERSRGTTTDSVKSYGLDFRYRFTFE